MEQKFTGRANRWSFVAPTALKTAGLGGMEHWSLGIERRMMDVQAGGVVWHRGDDRWARQGLYNDPF